MINGALSITVVKHVISQMYHITINKIGIVNPILGGIKKKYMTVSFFLGINCVLLMYAGLRLRKIFGQKHLLQLLR